MRLQGRPGWGGSVAWSAEARLASRPGGAPTPRRRGDESNRPGSVSRHRAGTRTVLPNRTRGRWGSVDRRPQIHTHEGQLPVVGISRSSRDGRGGAPLVEHGRNPGVDLLPGRGVHQIQPVQIGGQCEIVHAPYGGRGAVRPKQPTATRSVQNGRTRATLVSRPLGAGSPGAPGARRPGPSRLRSGAPTRLPPPHRRGGRRTGRRARPVPADPAPGRARARSRPLRGIAARGRSDGRRAPSRPGAVLRSRAAGRAPRRRAPPRGRPTRLP
ncbi:hypothetical protein SANTM175S_03925 [Streptomyces antimycoticus]